MKRRNLFSWLVLAPLIVLAGLLYSLWVWTGVDTSLASALSQASRYLPAGQTLVAEDVHGSLREGGRIGHLRWERNGLIMDARQVELGWSPVALLQRRLQLDKLHIAQLTIDDQSPTATASAPQGVVLPFRVSLGFIIDELRWTGPPTLQASALSGRYRFDGNHHQLTIDGVQIAAGQYHAQASLLARAPLTLDLQVQGALTAPVPGSSRTLPLVATASARGNLAGQDAVLGVQALLQPAPAGAPPAGSTAAQAMQATVSAQVSPWSPQPVIRADAAFTQLDLATLWPGAPLTLLTGTVRVQPDGNDWQGQVQVTNGLSGPWDKGRLPLDSALGQVRYDNGKWVIEALSANLAGGRLQLQGQVGTSDQGVVAGGWQGKARHVAPARPALAQRVGPRAMERWRAAVADPDGADG